MAKQTNKTTTTDNPPPPPVTDNPPPPPETDNPPPPPETDKTPALNRMIVGTQPIMEAGILYPPKSVVELPAARAKALGKLVSAAPEESED